MSALAMFAIDRRVSPADIQNGREVFLETGEAPDSFYHAVAEQMYRIVPDVQRFSGSIATYARRIPRLLAVKGCSYPVLVETSSPLEHICSWAGVKLNLEKGEEVYDDSARQETQRPFWICCKQEPIMSACSFAYSRMFMSCDERHLTMREGLFLACMYPFLLENATLLLEDEFSDKQCWQLARSGSGKMEFSPVAFEAMIDQVCIPFCPR